MAINMAFIIIYITSELIQPSDQCYKQLNPLLKDLRLRQNAFGSDEREDWEQKLIYCLLLLRWALLQVVLGILHILFNAWSLYNFCIFLNSTVKSGPN